MGTLTTPQNRPYRLTYYRLSGMRIPKSLLKASREGLTESLKRQITLMSDDITDLVNKKGPCILIYGPTGTGKSGAATVLVKAYTIKDNLRISDSLFMSIVELRSKRKTFEYSDVLKKCRKIDFLVLDGVSEDDVSDGYFWSDIRGLLSYRNVNRRATVVTSTLRADALGLKGSLLLEVPCIGPNRHVSEILDLGAQYALGVANNISEEDDAIESVLHSIGPLGA